MLGQGIFAAFGWACVGVILPCESPRWRDVRCLEEASVDEVASGSAHGHWRSLAFRLSKKFHTMGIRRPGLLRRMDNFVVLERCRRSGNNWITRRAVRLLQRMQARGRTHGRGGPPGAFGGWLVRTACTAEELYVFVLK